MGPFTDKVTLNERSSQGPAIAYLGATFIAWKGDGNENLNVAASTDYGHTFTGKYTSSETSPDAPRCACTTTPSTSPGKAMATTS